MHEFGGAVVYQDGTLSILAYNHQLVKWAYRPMDKWPCSVLRKCERVLAVFADNGDLVELIQNGCTEEIPGNELDAWVSDVLDSNYINHPAKRN